MADYFYKSNEPATVAIVRDFYIQRDTLNTQQAELGQLFGGKVASMRGITSLFTGGIKLSGGSELDVHWRRADDHGYRSLRSSAKPVKGTPKEVRAALRAEHERLVALWKEHCPKEVSIHDYWDRLGINSGNLYFSGAVKFELSGTAYFNLGFQINEAEHLANMAEGKPTSGWIEGAVEILSSEYEAARQAKLKPGEVTNA